MDSQPGGGNTAWVVSNPVWRKRFSAPETQQPNRPLWTLGSRKVLWGWRSVVRIHPQGFNQGAIA